MLVPRRSALAICVAASIASLVVIPGCGGSGDAASTAPAVEAADAVYTNAKVVTVDDKNSLAEAFAVKDGRFMAVGSSADVSKLVGPSTKVVNMGGRTVLPGLVDGHIHDAGGGPNIDLSKTRSIAELLDAIRVAVAAAPAGKLLESNPDWYHAQLNERRMPTLAELDSVAPNNPLVVHRGGLTSILNSAALAQFNITAATPQPVGGIIDKDGNGNLTGVLINAAQNLVTLPPAPAFDAAALATWQSKLNALGVTSVRVPGSFTGSDVPTVYGLIRQLQKDGKLNLRFQLLLDSRVNTAAKAQAIRTAAKLPAGSGDDWVRIWGVKTYIDGGFEGGFMTQPYAEPYGKGGTYYGLPLVTAQEHKDVVSDWAASNYRVAVHVVGDAALDLVLGVWEQLDQAKPGAVKGWTIEHAFVVRPDQYARLRALGVKLSVQTHLYYAAPVIAQQWGRARTEQVTPVKTFMDEGFTLTGGSDSPLVLNPFVSMYHFITRDTINDGVYGADQRIDRVAALRMYTINFAKLNNEAASKGSIEAGKFADFVAIGSDFMTIPEAEIKNVKVAATYVSGREVYKADGVQFGTAP
ncbi:MAG: amidohydrolase [Proteobacteria bacterium]|nr:amidohydrolase [Pseudomonadota bacterium]